MFSMEKILIPALLAALLILSSAADSLTIKAVNKLQIAHASQRIELFIAQLVPLGETDLEKIHVKDAAGIATQDAWKKYVDEFAQSVQSPVEVTVPAQ